MSTVKDRVDAPRALTPTASLAEHLVELGIKVPDQDNVRRMMLASRLRLPLDTPNDDMKFRFFRRVFSEQWTKFELKQYTALTPNTFGAPMPQSIASDVARCHQKDSWRRGDRVRPCEGRSLG